MKPPLLPLLLAGAALLPSWVRLPASLERWLFNPGERTEAGLEALEAGDVRAARRDFDTAARLLPEDPLTRFNAGTAALAAGAGDAGPELERAVELARGELQSRALYNLGNARLHGGDPAGAIEAYKEALRERPDQPDVKHNLEVALRRLEEERSGRRGEQETPEGESPGEREHSSATGADTPPDEKRQDPPGGEPRQPTQEDEAGSSRDPWQRGELPGFQEQPDMTADQAAAILQAVENLEREQRRRQAEKRRRASKKGDRDW